MTKDLRRYFWCCKACISLKIDVLLNCFRHDKILRLMLHRITAVSITVSHHIVAVWRKAAHEAATKISKSRHFTARWCSGQVYRMECGQIHDLHNVSSADSLLARLHPIVLGNAPLLAGMSIADPRPLQAMTRATWLKFPRYLLCRDTVFKQSEHALGKPKLTGQLTDCLPSTGNPVSWF